ncbi:50S ribosomal protein L18 [Spirochaetota bacterium]|nr:50S ribosomal protein L18 [Spirochaetota bacterium]
MSAVKNSVLAAKWRRKRSIRKKISGTASRPRISFFKSLRGLSVQLIDDRAERTLMAYSVRTGKNKKAATELAEKMAADDKAKKFRHFVFDRNGRSYHGVIQTFCETLRKNGFEF